MCRILFATSEFIPLVEARVYEVFKSLSAGGNTDACGFAVLREDGSVFKWKLPVTCEEVGLILAANRDRLRRLLKNAIYLMVHARKATGGTPLINENNHPFCDNRFCIIHNGSLHVASDTPRVVLDEWRRIADTDSAVLLALLRRCCNGKAKTLLDRAFAAFRYVTGKASVAIFDAKTREALYSRNKKADIVLVRHGDEFMAATASTTVDIILSRVEKRLYTDKLESFISMDKKDEYVILELKAKRTRVYTSYESRYDYMSTSVLDENGDSDEVTVYLKDGKIATILGRPLIEV